MHIIRACTAEDLLTLQEISCQTYNDTFAHLNSPANMKAYLEKSFHLLQLKNELSNKYSNFYFLYNERTLAGYLKLNEYQTQTDLFDPNSLELERIYLKKEFQGSGLGNLLINKAIDIAVQRDKSYLWLGVWEKNYKAIKFYQKYGFYEIGKHAFIMGDEEQTDYLLRKDI